MWIESSDTMRTKFFFFFFNKSGKDNEDKFSMS